MTVTLEIKPEIESILNAEAAAQGVGLDTFLQKAIEDLAHSRTASSSRARKFEAALK
jgi:hypothetical protein